MPTASSAAADGVGARRSATKSAMVKSVSWPTAEMTGTEQAAMARATRSSLNVHRSSSEPPPRATITTSAQPDSLKYRRPRQTSCDRALALHLRRKQPDVQTRETARQDVEHVADHGARRRGHDADAARASREGTLALRREQSLGGQLLLQLLERQLQRAVALRLQRFHQELVFAASFVDVDAPARQHRHAVLRLEFQIARGHAEADAAELRVSSFRVK